jgi:hypothetical protein
MAFQLTNIRKQFGVHPNFWHHEPAETIGGSHPVEAASSSRCRAFHHEDGIDVQIICNVFFCNDFRKIQ